MDSKNIWQNVSGKLAGENTKEQDAALDEWLQAEKTNRNIFERLLEIWNYNPAQVQDTSRMYQKFRNRVGQFEHTSRVHNFVSYGLRISAILLLLVGMTILIQKFILPGNETQLAYNEIFVPKGNRTFVVLPDSTKVWISNSTKLKYPHEFSGKTRELFLTGEAYFEVAHNKHKPFIVNIGANRIKVLGTKFSVTAYPEDNLVRADLISGKIQFDIRSGESSKNYKSFFVTPGHSMEFNKATNTITDSEIPEGFYDYWLHGLYAFKNESLESLARKVKRIYNVEIIFEDEYLKSKRYNGSFSVDDNIFNFIEAIKQTSVEPVEYRLDGNKLFINLKK